MEKIEEKSKEETLYKMGLKEINDFAKIVDLSPSYIRKLMNNNKLDVEVYKGKRYLKFGNSLVALIKYYKELYKANDVRKDRDDLINKKLEAEIKFKTTQNALQEINKDMKSGRYLVTEKAEQEIKNFLLILKNLYLSLPAMVMGEIESDLKKERIREVQHKLEKKINNIFEKYVDSGREIEEIKEKGKIEINEAGEEKKKRGKKKK